MATQKQQKSISEIVDTHKPKNFKYYFDFKHDETLIELEKQGYPLSELDTINNTALINLAKQASYQYYDRDIISHAKEPTVLENGVMIIKKMATKTDRKLQNVGVGFFDANGVSYVAVKLCYELFDIYEIFIMT